MTDTESYIVGFHDAGLPLNKNMARTKRNYFTMRNVNRVWIDTFWQPRIGCRGVRSELQDTHLNLDFECVSSSAALAQEWPIYLYPVHSILR